jgi:hypothetical protein
VLGFLAMLARRGALCVIPRLPSRPLAPGSLPVRPDRHAAGAGLDAIDLIDSELGHTHLGRVLAAYSVVSRENV